MKRFLTIEERSQCDEDLRRRYVQWCRTQNVEDGVTIWADLEKAGIVASAKVKTPKPAELSDEQLAAEIDALNNN